MIVCGAGTKRLVLDVSGKRRKGRPKRVWMDYHQARLDAEGIIRQWSFTERLVRSRLQWAGHVERMADDRLPKRAAELREQGRRRRGRPRLRWEDCVKRDVKKTEEDGDWKKKTGHRRGWKRLADEAEKKLQAAPHP